MFPRCTTKNSEKNADDVRKSTHESFAYVFTILKLHEF